MGNRRHLTGFFVAGALAALVCPAAPAVAQTSCAELAALKPPAADVIASETVAAGAFLAPDDPATAPVFAGVPAFCRIRLVARPSADSDIRVEVWLPVAGWNGRFQAVGNGGWAGVIPYESLAAAVSGGYATAGTDTGHAGATAAFAPGRPEKVVDMAHRAVHEMTVLAKTMIAAHYGALPKLSIWNGCSTGGRQGITAAVRYPEDFDAIVAGAPAVQWMHLHAGRIALHQRVTRPPAQRIPPGKYPIVHAATLNACDGLDGVVDGVLEDPRACAVDLSVLQCQGGDSATCLTRGQVEAAAGFYAPVVHPQTGELVMPGLERGSELGWSTLGGAEPLGNALEAFRHVVYQDARWDWRSFNLANDLGRALAADVAGLGSTDPDLRVFFARGGKLLLYHGWSDPQVPPRNTVNFFDRVVQTAGPDAVGRAVQLYMVPGMAHCRGGPGADRFDAVGLVERWAASGAAPDRVVASRVTNGTVIRTRLLCPYGRVARWDGRGSIDEAASFSCVAVGLR